MDSFRRLVAHSRPRFWLYLAGPALVGLAYGVTTPWQVIDPFVVALLLYFLIPANLFLYGINDIFDAEVDRHNPKKAGPETRYRGDPTLLAAVGACGGLGIGLVALAPRGAVPWLVGFIALGVAYSAPPLRFKTTPGLDSITNGLYLFPGAAAYVVVADVQPPIMAVAGAWLWTMGMHTYSAIPDIRSDRRVGIATTATALGPRGSYAYVGACWTLAALAFAALDPRLGALLGIYPGVIVVTLITGLNTRRVYWWFPAINGLVGAALTMGGIWVMVHG